MTTRTPKLTFLNARTDFHMTRWLLMRWAEPAELANARLFNREHRRRILLRIPAVWW